MANERMLMRERHVTPPRPQPIAIPQPEREPEREPAIIGEPDGTRLRRSRIPVTHQLNRRAHLY
jgi:hypothetical protein